MAFTLQIRQKKQFGETILSIPSPARACGFHYVSNNEFYILREGKQNQGTAIFDTPGRIGRGICFDGRRAQEGDCEISHNIPTTPAEMDGDYKAVFQEMETVCGLTVPALEPLGKES